MTNAPRAGGIRTMAVIACAWLIFATSFTADDLSFFGGVPLRTTYPNPISFLDNEAFVVGYDEIRKVPAWAAYRLFPDPGTFEFPRPARFSVDERTEARVTHDDYTKTGFSRGHMAPNFAIMSRYGREAQLATFMMSNVTPQLQALNGGPWENLESRIANDFANNLEEVWVLVGPIFDGAVESLASGVEIPDRFYMIVIDEENVQPRALAFIMSKDTHSPAKLEAFLVSIDTIESATGLDFLSGLADTVEAPLEATAATGLWSTAGVPPIPSPTDTLININTAPSEDLELLPGIGPTMAQRIVLGRPYTTVDGLLRVNGIGAATLERLRPLVTVED